MFLETRSLANFEKLVEGYLLTNLSYTTKLFRLIAKEAQVRPRE